MAETPLQHRYKLLATASNHEELLKTVELLADSVADVRTKIPGMLPADDTIAVRAACAAILKDMVDSVRRIRNNSRQRPGSDSNEDEPL